MQDNKLYGLAIEDAVIKYQSEHNNCTKQECSLALQIPTSTVGRYWKYYLTNLSTDIEKKETQDKVTQWQLNNPNSSMRKCMNDLNINSLPTLKNYWNPSLNTRKRVDLKKFDNFKEKITNWQLENPQGTMTECCDYFDTNHITLRKYWNKELDKRENKTDRTRNLKKEVLDFQSNNPYSSKSECSKKVKISLISVRKYWNNDLDLRVFKDDKFKVNILNYQISNPCCSQCECANDLHISKHIVSKYWDRDLSNKPTIKEKVKQWQLDNVLSSESECCKQLSLDFSIIARNWDKSVEEYNNNLLNIVSNMAKKNIELNINNLIKYASITKEEATCFIKSLLKYQKIINNVYNYQYNHPFEIKKNLYLIYDIDKVLVHKIWDLTSNPNNVLYSIFVNENMINLDDYRISIIRQWQRENPTKSQAKFKRQYKVKMYDLSKYWKYEND